LVVGSVITDIARREGRLFRPGQSALLSGRLPSPWRRGRRTLADLRLELPRRFT